MSSSEKKVNTSPDLVLIDIAEIDPHPGHPRLGLNENVVGGIELSLRRSREYPSEHAITVRLKPSGRYEILQGRFRAEACSRAMVRRIWAFVIQATDEEAHQMLAFGNNQGELGSLEIGLHALETVQKAQGRAGMGVKAYASRMGLKEQNLSRYIEGARVFRVVEAALRTSNINIGSCGQKADHFEAISKAPEESWTELCLACLTDKWSVAKTRAQVSPAPALIRAQPVVVGDTPLTLLARTDPTFAGFVGDLLNKRTVLGCMTSSTPIQPEFCDKWAVLKGFATFGEVRDAVKLLGSAKAKSGSKIASPALLLPENGCEDEPVVQVTSCLAAARSLPSASLADLLRMHWLLQRELRPRLSGIGRDLIDNILAPGHINGSIEEIDQAAEATASLIGDALDDLYYDLAKLAEQVDALKGRYVSTGQGTAKS